MRPNAVDHLLGLFEARGHCAYGEHVTQLEHALQCATLAQTDGAPTALVVAALVHDIGHILYHEAAEALALGRDDRHEVLGAQYLKRWFGDEVTQPVRLHVEAKRYLCFADPTYASRLSAVSQQSLLLQGDVMSAHEAAAFLREPFARDAIRLRHWDEAGKQPGLGTPPLAYFRAMLQACMRPADMPAIWLYV